MTGDPIYPNTTIPMRSGPEKGPITNADRIRAMSNEELVRVIGRACPEDYCCGKCVSDCEECWLNWLQSLAEGGGRDG